MMKESEKSKITVALFPNSRRNALPAKSSKASKQYYSVGAMSLFGVMLLMVLQQRDNAQHKSNSSGRFEGVERLSVQHENFSANSFQQKVLDWDKQRAAWKEAHPNLMPLEGKIPKVLMVTGSSPEQSESIMESHFLLRTGKNKLDYSRIHDMELYYSMGRPDPDLEFNAFLVNLPVIRMLMLQHPEVEWIWWVHTEAIFTNMSFEPLYAELQYHNLVLYGVDWLAHEEGDRKMLSTGAYMIRNCQWSLDLIGAWTEIWAAGIRGKDESGNDPGNTLFSGVNVDDHTSLVALLAEDRGHPIDRQQWVPLVRLVNDAEDSISWNLSVPGPKLEGLSPDQVPFVTHFRSCLQLPTSSAANLSQKMSDACMQQMDRALNSADKQVFEKFGVVPHILGSFEEMYVSNDTDYDAIQDRKDFRLLPAVTDWDERRQAFIQDNPGSVNVVMLTSGSSSNPCSSKEEAHLLLKGLKNWIDYSRIHGIKAFYNMAQIDKTMTGSWSKIPLLRMLMLNNPATEWIWWTENNCLFTDMNFQIPFDRFKGYNLALYGNKDDRYNRNDTAGINAGIYLIRNCQWSLDLLDRLSSFGVQDENENLSNFLSNYGDFKGKADDQFTLIYLLDTETEKWASQVHFDTHFGMDDGSTGPECSR